MARTGDPSSITRRGQVVALALLLLGGAQGGCAAVPLVLVGAGDLQLGAGSEHDPLSEVAPLLAGDLRVVNLEGPLTDRGGERGLGPDGALTGAPLAFAASPRKAAWLRGRIEVAALANNHAGDQGQAGLTDTVAALRRVGVVAATATRDAVLRRRGRRVVVIARELPEPIAPAAVEELLRAIGRARGLVVLSLHWGRAGNLLPSLRQREVARALVAAGARVVLGHGPHTVQGVERLGRGVVAYSLGNLAFSCGCTDQEDAFALRVRFGPGEGLEEVRLLPLRAGLRGGPARPWSDTGLLELLGSLSRDLGAHPELEGETLLLR